MQIKPENSIDIDSYGRFMLKECWIMVFKSEQLLIIYFITLFFFNEETLFVTLFDVHLLHAFYFIDT